ncbi:hypothetical protein CANCADRAFT_15892, partial [Tortispora caseinolytica NRRL Y-17796]
ADNYAVHSLPNLADGVELPVMHAGLLELAGDGDPHMFFWRVQSSKPTNKTVIWLNGGPGCSSMDGMFLEIGPFRAVDGNFNGGDSNVDPRLVPNPGAWNEYANILFIDSPVGTGFSYADRGRYDHEIYEVADDIVAFLDAYFELFPTDRDNDLYVAGESFAGTYIPYIARAMLDHDLQNLKGLLMGNPYTDPPRHFFAYAEMAFESGLIPHDSPQAKTVSDAVAHCTQELTKYGVHINVPACESILDTVLSLSKPSKNTCINMYDIRLQDSYPACGINWPPALSATQNYLRLAQLVKAINLPSEKQFVWKECDGSVSRYLRAYNSTPAVDLLPDLLQSVPILFFNGDKDLICNHYGNERLIANLEWNGDVGFRESAKKEMWSFNGSDVGEYTFDRGLTYLRVYNASHMVPVDYPEQMKYMLADFIGAE